MNKMEQRRLTKLKKLFEWEDTLKELSWIFFWLFLFLAVYGYNTDIKSCNAQLNTQCVWNCRVEEFRQNLQDNFPGAQIMCDYKTNRCDVFGSPVPEEFKKNFPRLKDIIINISDFNVSE